MSRKLSIVIAIILLFTQISVVFAAEAPSLTTKVETHILPEYDTTDVLVINALSFTNASKEPYQGQVRFSVPKGTSSNIVIENNNENRVQVTVEDKGEYAELVWQPSQPIQPNATYSVHLEYYYNPLPGTGNKSFNFKYVPSYPIDNIKFYIYQPLKATDLKVEPTAQLLGQDDKGFNVYGLDFSGLLPEAPVELKVSYTKNDPQPSIQQQAAPNAGAAPASDSGIKIPSWPVLLAVAALGGLIIVLAIRSRNSDDEDDEDEDEETAGNFAAEKKELVQKLKRGLITEQNYEELLAELEEKYR